MKPLLFSIIGLSMVFSGVYATDIQLPVPQKTGGMPLMEALNARQTQRTFSPEPLSEQ